LKASSRASTRSSIASRETAGSSDFAVLDINLAGRLSFPIADVLRDRGIPFLFASGYGSNGVSDDYRNAVRIQKPFASRDLAQAIAKIAR
jgi:hypothetical protein